MNSSDRYGRMKKKERKTLAVQVRRIALIIMEEIKQTKQIESFIMQ